VKREGWLGRVFGAALLCLSLLAGAAHAEAPVPPLERRVTDLTGTLTPDQQSALEARLAAFEQQKGSQIAILIVPTTQPEDIAQYSIRVVDVWKLGRKGVDDGVLVLLAKADRALRIEVGYGLEGSVPDAIARRIADEVMIPRFRKGDFYGGFSAGIDRLIGVIEGEPLPQPQNRQPTGGGLEQYFAVLLFAAVMVGGILRAVLGRFLGATVNAGLVGGAVWLLGGGLIFVVMLAFMAFMIALGGGRGFHGGMGGGGFGRGSGGGGFSGGGGGFGGGGAPGRW
jgi:uncharacterized protein